MDKKERDKQEEIAFQKRLQAIKSRARPFTEEENQRMEDRVKTTLNQLRDSQQPSNGPVVTTGADRALEVLPSCSSSSVSESPARQPSLPLPSLSDEDKRRDDELVANILKKLGWN